MNKLPKEKRNRLVLVAFGTLAVLAALYFLLIQWQQDRLERSRQRTGDAEHQLAAIQRAIQEAPKFEAQLSEAAEKLAALEEDMASGDLYAWIITALRKFKLDYNVDIPQFSQQVEVTDCSLLPNFPYRQAKLGVAGTAYYHDFGVFLADLENRFPHFRVENILLEPSRDVTPAGREKLEFRMEVVALVKPST